MKAVLRLNRSQQMALQTVLMEYVTDKNKIQTFVDVSTDPPTETTTGDLLQIIGDVTELVMPDDPENGKQYKGVVVGVASDNSVFVALTETIPRKHLKVLERNQGTGGLQQGDAVLCQYNGELSVWCCTLDPTPQTTNSLRSVLHAKC